MPTRAATMMNEAPAQERPASAEHARLAEASADHPGDWKAIGPYLTERAWGTVREDYSADGEAWGYFPYEHARSRAYRWNEDGLAGISDLNQHLCFAMAFWNGRDPFLKERLFGLSGPEGNHGEDVKEYWWYADATPTASWLSWRYHYPQSEFPYQRLREENARRGRHDPEFELIDTGTFDEDRYWRIVVDYAKAGPRDLCVRIEIRNAGPETAELHVLPTLWFRNRWSWGDDDPRPSIKAAPASPNATAIAEDAVIGRWRLTAGPDPTGRVPELLFCENETNMARLFGVAARTPYPKDGINDHVVAGAATVNPAQVGTKMACWHRLAVAPGERVELRLRLARDDATHASDLGADFDLTLAKRRREADEYYATLQARRRHGRRSGRHAPSILGSDLEPAILSFQRPALAGRRSDRTAAARRSAQHTQRRMAALELPRYSRDARQVGIPVVRRVGSRLPMRGARPCRRGGGEASASSAESRMVHASERPVAGLRMEFQRREPARPGVGRVGGLQYRRRQGFRFPGARISQAADHFHLVGQPQRRTWRQHLRGRLPRARQYRAVQPLGGAARRGHTRAIRRHGMDGEALPQHAGDGDSSRQSRSLLRGRGAEILRALREDRCRHERTLGRRRRFLL